MKLKAEPDAIMNPEWQFSAMAVPIGNEVNRNELKNTLVGGDTTFLRDLDPDFVVDDLVDYEFVKIAMEKHTGWKNAPGFNAANPFDREEMISL